MPYRQNAESLQQILDDATELAMAPPRASRRPEIQRMRDRIDRAIALAEVAPDARDDEVIQSLKQVRAVLDAQATAGRHTSFELRAAVDAADEAAARASPRGVQLRIVEVTLKESAVVAAQGAALRGEQRERLVRSVSLLRGRYESGLNLLRVATLEPCSDAHARLLERKVERLEGDLERVYQAWQRGHRRLSRA